MPNALRSRLFPPIPAMVDSKLYKKPIYKTIWVAVLLILFIFIIPSFPWRITWMFLNWNSITSHHIDQLIVCLLYLTSSLIHLPAFYTQWKHGNEIAYAANQLFQLVQQLSQKFPSLFIVDSPIKLPFGGRIMVVMELIDYSLSISLLKVFIGVLFLPLAISYEHVQFVLGNNSILAKMFSSFFTSCLCATLQLLFYHFCFLSPSYLKAF